jgi:3-oxoacyl-[acyl-carrier protein] reductase
MNISFKDKQIFITGGNRGIGKTIAESFSASGGKVNSPLRSEMDLSNKDSVENFLKKNEYSPDIVVLNAAVNKIVELEKISYGDLQEAFQTNLFSSIEILKSFVPAMKKNNGGKIVFISSVYAFVTREKRIMYTSSKNAVTGLMKTLAVELAPFNIMVNAVAPGYIMTDMTKKNLSLDEIREIENIIPTKRFQTEEDIANLVLFLSSEYNRSITGQLIAVDGGFLCR